MIDYLDALFILSLFRHSTSTCFGHICSPSSGGILYIYKWYVFCFLVDCLLASRPTDSQLVITELYRDVRSTKHKMNEYT